jgi:PAS domain S-box-containing protein
MFARATLISLLLVGLLLWANFFVPLGYSTWLLYLVPLAIVWVFANIPALILVALFATAALIAGFFVAPPGIDPSMAAVDRTVQVVASWVFVLLLIRVTQLKEQARKRELRNQKQLSQLRAIVDMVTEGLVVVDADGNVVAMNPAARTCYGIASGMSLHLNDFRNLLELEAPEGRELPFDEWPVARVLRGEKLKEYEVRERRRDTGKEWVASYCGGPVLDGEAHLVQAVLTFRDITEQRKMEEHLRLLQQNRVRPKPFQGEALP